MAATVWKGYLTFGMVLVPVRLYRAARAERVKLRQLYRPQRTEAVSRNVVSIPTANEAPQASPAVPEYNHEVAPVRRVYQAAGSPDESQLIPSSDLVKGFEYTKGEYVVLDDQEIRELAPQTTSEMQIVEFVRFEEIDPVFLETSYYVVPEEIGAKAYVLLFEAMREAGYAAIGNLAMHRRDHVVVVRAGKHGLIAHTMFYLEEVRADLEVRADRSLVAAKELALAKTLIGALAQPFDPSKFKNQFRERLAKLIESRGAGRQAQVEHAEPGKTIDIMDALRRSLAEVKSTERKPATQERPTKKRRTRQTS
jgi:DNA end-binding protein Ku